MVTRKNTESIKIIRLEYNNCEVLYSIRVNQENNKIDIIISILGTYIQRFKIKENFIWLIISNAQNSKKYSDIEYILTREFHC